MKMKSVKKLIAASLVTVMAVNLAGCGDQPAAGDNGSSQPAASQQQPSGGNDAGNAGGSDAGNAGNDDGGSTGTVGQYTVLTDENGNVYDLGGMEVIIRDWWSGEPAEPSDAYEEARAEYREWIQETYNFTIKEQQISDWGSTPEDFLNYATTGGDENYVFTLRQGAELTSAMNSGLMYDVASLNVFDFSEAKWSSQVHKMFSKGDKVYGFRGIPAEPRMGIYFNKRLLEEAGMKAEELYAIQESGDWTWDKFEEICKMVQQDKDNDGEIDVYGMVVFTSDWYGACVASNDADFIGKDADGKYEYQLESDETMEALNWALKTIDEYSYPQPADSNWDYWVEAFQTGKGVFFGGAAYQAGQEWKEENMADEVGFLCFPKGPHASDYMSNYTDNVYAIPSCYDAEKAKKIAFAYNVYTDDVPGYEGYNGYLSDYYNKFRDTESVDYTIKRMMKVGRITYHDLIADLAMGPDLLWNINKDNTPAQAAEAIRNTWKDYVDKANQ